MSNSASRTSRRDLVCCRITRSAWSCPPNLLSALRSSSVPVGCNGMAEPRSRLANRATDWIIPGCTQLLGKAIFQGPKEKAHENEGCGMVWPSKSKEEAAQNPRQQWKSSTPHQRKLGQNCGDAGMMEVWHEIQLQQWVVVSPENNPADAGKTVWAWSLI